MDLKNWTSLITAMVAVGSLTLNIFQWWWARSDQQHALVRSDCTAEGFFAYANDNRLIELYAPGDNQPDWSSNTLEFAHRTDVDIEIKDYVKAVIENTQNRLRRGPVASFFVITNVGERAITNISALTGNPSSESRIVSISFMPPNKYIMIPLDFRPPGNDGTEPEVPSQVVIRYKGCPDKVVTPQTEINWLTAGLTRALIEE